MLFFFPAISPPTVTLVLLTPDSVTALFSVARNRLILEDANSSGEGSRTGGEKQGVKRDCIKGAAAEAARITRGAASLPLSLKLVCLSLELMLNDEELSCMMSATGTGTRSALVVLCVG